MAHSPAPLLRGVASDEGLIARRSGRLDIQALRALAVSGVVLFHLWPGVLRGGYVGVDVFFVISGYLITNHLLREVDKTGRIRLGTFWARRMRRLLPVAYLVLLTTLVGVVAFVPRGLWEINFREVIASAAYAENWVLAANSVDYLNAENAASASQHYWSLSVEEQFYLLWPFLLLAAAWIARRSRGSRRGLIVLLATVASASLIASIVTTSAAPGPAYFVTWTRAWEFALGALVAASGTALPARIGGPGRLLGWVTLGAVTFLYTEGTPFPGWTAAVPAAATALVIWAGDPGPSTAVSRISGLWPIQSIGTISYSLYLWHWPVLIVGGYATTRVDTLPGRITVLLISLGAAAATYRLVENPMRHQRWLSARPGRTLIAGLVAGVAICGIALVGLHHTAASVQASSEEATKLLNGGAACLGAADTLGTRQPCRNPDLDGVLVPNLTARLRDTGGAYRCYDQTPSGEVKSCTLGSDRPDALRVALVGDSHAASILPGLEPRLTDLNWRLDTYIGRGCVWGRDARSCPGHVAAVEKRLLDGPPYDLVLITARRNQTLPAGEHDPAVASFAAAWTRLAARGTDVVAVADDPTLPASTYACTQDADSAAALEKCSMTRAEAWRLEDPIPAAVARANNPRISLVDLSGAYCIRNRCPVVIGHVITYRDQHHITATFSRTLGPYLIDGIGRAIRR